MTGAGARTHIVVASRYGTGHLGRIPRTKLGGAETGAPGRLARPWGDARRVRFHAATCARRLGSADPVSHRRWPRKHLFARYAIRRLCSTDRAAPAGWRSIVKGLESADARSGGSSLRACDTSTPHGNACGARRGQLKARRRPRAGPRRTCNAARQPKRGRPVVGHAAVLSPRTAKTMEWEGRGVARAVAGPSLDPTNRADRRHRALGVAPIPATHSLATFPREKTRG